VSKRLLLIDLIHVPLLGLPIRIPLDRQKRLTIYTIRPFIRRRLRKCFREKGIGRRSGVENGLGSSIY